MGIHDFGTSKVSGLENPRNADTNANDVPEEQSGIGGVVQMLVLGSAVLTGGMTVVQGIYGRDGGIWVVCARLGIRCAGVARGVAIRLSYVRLVPATVADPSISIAMRYWLFLTQVKDDLQRLRGSWTFVVLVDATLDLVDATAIAWRRSPSGHLVPLETGRLPLYLLSCPACCLNGSRLEFAIRLCLLDQAVDPFLVEVVCVFSMWERVCQITVTE